MKGDFITKSVEAPATVTTGAATDVSNVANAELQVSGTFSATMQLEGSQDGSHWTQIGADITAAGFYAIAPRVAQVRIKTTVHSSGSPVASVAGDES